MADTVQYLMEKMIPELVDMERRGYFSRAEIKKIVQKRQDFEYLLKRRTALKEDYYRYIEFETKLEELRRSRKQKRHIKGKKSIADVEIVRRIHFIYERAGRKFRSDISLWMRWIETCKCFKSSKQLSKVITKALRRHSTVSELWVEAARWEFERDNNMAAARSLMQQGIRMCKTDENIWVQYYLLELLYALKLCMRRRVLGLVDSTGSAIGDDEVDGQSEAAVCTIMQGGIARIVYKNAIAAMPGRFAFRARFIDVLRRFEYGFVEGLLEQVYDSIRQDFGKVDEEWDLLARRHVDFPSSRRKAISNEAAAAEGQLEEQAGVAGGLEQQQPDSNQAWDEGAHQQACAVYEEGLTAVVTPRMFQLFADYLCWTLGRLMEQGEDALQPAVTVAAKLFGLLQRAHSSSCSTPKTYLTWVDWAEKVQQPKMARKAACKGCERFPTDMAMWQRRLQLEVALNQGHEHAVQNIMRTFETALKSTAPEQSCEVWLMAIETLPSGSQEFARLGDLLATTCARVAKKAPTGGFGHVAAALVEKTRASQGPELAQHLCTKLLTVPAPGGDLYRCAITLEREAQLSEGCGSGAPSKKPINRLTELFEGAVAMYGRTEVDLWLKYALWLVQIGKGSGQVFWRATKELADPDAFITQYREALQ